MKTERQVSIELLRIVCILMIIFSHATQYLYGGSWWELYQTNFSLNFLVALILGIWGQVSVAAFVVTSSYFQVDKSKIHSKKLIMLLFQTIFLTFFGYCIAIIYNQNFSVRTFFSSLYQSIQSPFNGTYWFITTYLFFYMLCPLMQFISDKLSKESLQHICIILMFMVFGLAFFEKSSGGTLLEFCSLYFIVAYIKKYKEQDMKKKCRKYLIFGLIMIISCCLGLNLLSFLSGKQIFYKAMSRVFVNWNPLLIMTAISLFYFFKYYVNISSNCVSKFICNLSKTSLGIYILHENSIFGKNTLWCNWLNLGDFFRNSQMFPIYFIGSILFIFIICAATEFIRLKLIDEYFFRKHTKKLDNLCHKFDNYYLCTIEDKIDMYHER